MVAPKTPWHFFSRLLIVGIVLTVVGLAFVLAFGLVEGTQISPSTFQIRSYEYFRLPGTGVQLTPVKYEIVRNPLAAHLSDAGILDPAASGSDWVEVSYFSPGARHLRGRAWVLAAAVQLEASDGGSVWLDWTQDHPEAASVLWKCVALAARDGVYFVIPDLLDTARRAPHADLQRTLNDLLRVAYQQQIGGLIGDEHTARRERLRDTLEGVLGATDSPAGSPPA